MHMNITWCKMKPQKNTVRECKDWTDCLVTTQKECWVSHIVGSFGPFLPNQNLQSSTHQIQQHIASSRAKETRPSSACFRTCFHHLSWILLDMADMFKFVFCWVDYFRARLLDKNKIGQRLRVWSILRAESASLGDDWTSLKSQHALFRPWLTIFDVRR